MTIMTAPIPPPSRFLLTAVSLVLLSSQCLAFAPPAAVRKTSRRHDPPPTRRSPILLAAGESTTSRRPPALSSLEKLEVVKLALKRPRGASVGVEYAPAVDANLNDGDLSVLSMQLRKAKCAAIWTSDARSAARIAAEQEGARGDFPGPVPVICYGSEAEDVLVQGGDVGATAVVLEHRRDVDVESFNEVGIIWKVDTMDQVQELLGVEESAGGVFLLSREMLPESNEEDADELKEMLSNLPKSVVTIAPLPAMLPENKEISLGKHYASLGISSLLLEKACVGDEEDAQYSQYAIEGINKKSSSSFSMIGLTGSTNGHFGVSSHGGETKWRRNG